MRDEVGFSPPDGGFWAWLVCAASCWTNGTVFGVINSFGVLLVAMKDLDGADVFKTAWVGSMCSGLTFMMSPIASYMTDRFGCRATALIGGSIASVGLFVSSFVDKIELLYVTYGLLIGAGFSIAYTPSLVILGHYFKKRIGLANGIVATGSSIFTIALPFLIQSILNKSGLKSTLRYMTSITIVMTLASFVFKPRFHKEVKKIVDEKGDMVKKKSVIHRKQSVFNKVNPFKKVSSGLWKNKRFRIWSIGVPLALFGYFVPFFHLVNHINDVLPNVDAPIAIACLGATSGIGRLISGPLSDHPRVNGIFIQQLAFLMIGVCTTLLPICHNFAALLVTVSVMGFFDGFFVCMMGPIAFDLVGPRQASQALGIVLGLMSIPMTVGPPIAGLIYDLTKSYNVAFFLSGLSPIIGACFLMLIYRIPKDTAPAVLEDEYEDDIGDVFDDEDTKLGMKSPDYGRLKKEPSVRRPSGKSTVTFSEDNPVIEEKTEFINSAEEYVAMDIPTTSMGKKRHVQTKSNEYPLLNGNILLHRTQAEETKLTNGHVTDIEDYETESTREESLCLDSYRADTQESNV